MTIIIGQHRGKVMKKCPRCNSTRFKIKNKGHYCYCEKCGYVNKSLASINGRSEFIDAKGEKIMGGFSTFSRI